jgi:hypothetical protein
MSKRVLTPQYFKSLSHPRLLLMSNLRRVLKFRIVQTMRGGFRNEIGQQARARQPHQIRLFPQPGYQWKKPVAVSKLAGPLAARGFTDLGPYRIDVMPEVTVRFLVNPTVSVYACVHEHAKAGIWLDLVSRYEDGSRATFTTLRSNGIDQRPQDTIVRAPSATSETLYGRMLRERPQRTLLRLDAVTAIRLFEAAYAEQMLWRQTEGISACEVSNVAAT